MNSIETNTFSIYRSSAGSGKTYQLALEFISLAIQNPGLFNKILAVTFTNKATKEMKERILDFLIKLSLGQDKDLLNKVMEKTSLSEKEIARNAKDVVGKILHQYSQFSISTIDAFFQKIVKSFAKELGLLGNFKVELDQDKVKQEIIDQIIDELGENKELTEWLVDFSFSKVDENKSWNIRPQIESLANEVFKESFRPVGHGLSEINRNDFKKFLDQVRKIKQRFEKEMKAEAKKALDLIKSHGLAVDDFSYKGSGPAGYYNRILVRSDYEPKARVNQALENPEKWYSKSSPKKGEIQKVVESGLQEITASLVRYYNEHLIAYTTASEVLKNIYVFGILSQIIKKLKIYRQENDVMLISDVPMFLNGIIADNETPFIYEKTGTWYQNYLIDEFQDTSGFQWQNFKPLVENSLAQGNQSLLVGDGKQSIYRWRGGDWNLILNKVVEDLRSYQPEEKYLNTNWRSARKIIEFNNALFNYLPSVIGGGFNHMVGELSLPASEKNLLLSKIADIEKLYEDVEQLVAKKNIDLSKGRIEINAYQKGAPQSWKEQALEELPLAIEKLQLAGYQAKDIAVLIRKGDEGKQVIEQLIKYKRSEKAKKSVCYDAISNESLFLGNSSAIRIIINTITYSLDPDNKIAFGEICYNYNFLLGREISNPENGDLNFILEGDILPESFGEACASLIKLPVYEMIERIIQLFHLVDNQHKGYLQAFQDVVLDYFANEKKGISDFLAWWDEKGKRKSIQIPESVNAIQVMTIHKSKGLEFKAVLVPFCDWKLDHDATKSNYLWCKTDQKPYEEIGYLPLKYSSSLANSYFAQEYFEEMIKAHIDNLNLLYVAFTRAEEYLLINCPPISKEIKTAGDLVIKGIERLISGDESQNQVQTEKDEESIHKYSIGSLDPVSSSPDESNALEIGSGYVSSNWRQKIALRKKGGVFFTEKGEEKKAKINYGLLVHEILASIKNQKEAEVAVERYYLEGQISSEDKQTLTDQLNHIFSNPQVQSWFNTDWEVKAEVAIVVRNGYPKRPDRVLINGKKAIIIDFKTGLEKQIDQKQVVTYKNILAEMGFKEIKAYLLYIAMNKVIEVA